MITVADSEGVRFLGNSFGVAPVALIKNCVKRTPSRGVVTTYESSAAATRTLEMSATAKYLSTTLRSLQCANSNWSAALVRLDGGNRTRRQHATSPASVVKAVIEATVGENRTPKGVKFNSSPNSGTIPKLSPQ